MGIKRSVAARAGVAALSGALLVLGCLSPPPSREGAPSAAPAPATPASEQAPPLEAPPAPAPASPTSAEGKASAPQAEPTMMAPRPAGERPPARSGAARAPANKARARSAAADADHELGSAGAAPQAPAVLREQLERAERAATPDCPAARERKKSVCDLASQICRLTERDPNVASVAEYCADAKRRCSDAGRRTAEHCPD